MIIGVSERLRSRAQRIEAESSKIYNIASIAASIESVRKGLREMEFCPTGPEITALDKVLSCLNGWGE